MSRLIDLARRRADLSVLVAVLIAVPLLPGGVPGGIVGTGVVAGAALAVQAVGLVLVYRSDRIINFAQVQIGVVAAVLFRLMIEHDTLLGLLGRLCRSCERAPGTRLIAAQYWLSMALALALAVGLSWLIYRGVIRRFARAPRLVLTVATIGLAQLLGSVQELLPGLFATERQRELDQIPRGIAAPPPIDGSFTVSPAVFRAPDILTVVIAALAIVGVMLIVRRARLGIGIRAAAENPDRASTLGVDVARVTGRVWMIAGALSGITALLAAMSTASPPPGALSISGLVRILAVAIVARMISIPIAAIAGLALGIFDRALLWSIGQSGPADAIFTVVIIAMLLLQRDRGTRAEQELVGAWRAAREVRPIPDALRRLPDVQRFTGAGARTAMAVLLLGLPFVLTPTQTNTATIAVVYAMVGVSILVLSGWAGQISLGQFALAGVGAAVTVSVAGGLGLPLLPTMALAAAAGAIAAIAVGLPALRMRGLHLAVTTLAVAVSVAAMLDPDVLGGRLPERIDRPSFIGIDLDDTRTFFYAALVVLGLVLAAARGVRRSRVGRALIAARDNEASAQAFGVRVVRARLGAFAFSGAIAGVAGSVFAYHQNGVRVADFTAEVSVIVFLMTIIGGLGSPAGPVIGAVYLGVLTTLSVSPFVLFLATGGGVVVLLMLLPGGLNDLVVSARDGLLRRAARRARIPVPSLGVHAGETRRAPLAPKDALDTPRYRIEDQWGLRAPEEVRR